MADSENQGIALVERIYGFNWASVGSRERGLEELEEMIAPEFESRMSEEVGGRMLKGVDGLRAFGDALEQDFHELQYDPSSSTPRRTDGSWSRAGSLASAGRAECR